QRQLARMQAAEMGAAPTQVDSMWWKRRADGHIVDGNDLRAGEHRHSGDLQSLLIELRYQRRTDFLKQSPQRILEWIARRQATHARVARLRATKARELAVQRLSVLRQQALPRVRVLQPATYPVRQVPQDAIVVERDLPAIRKDAQRSELPRDT